MSTDPMTSAHAWLDIAAERLDLPRDLVRSSIRPILDLTKDVAHNRSRPAAPVTAFLIGLHAGRTAGSTNLSDADIAALVAELSESIATEARGE